MTNPRTSTLAIAMTLVLGQSPTFANPLGGGSPQRVASSSSSQQSSGFSETAPVQVVVSEPEPDGSLSALRETTALEKLIGEVRGWSMLQANWDGEGAVAPSSASIKQASSFACLLTAQQGELVEPMLHASGRAGLYWNEPGLYADIEFFGDGRVAYYIERGGEKHKGVVNFDTKEMPPVFSTLLLA